MDQVLSRAGGQNVQLGLISVPVYGAHFCVVEHPIALLLQECHINRTSVRGSNAIIPENRLSLDEVRGGQ